MQQIHFRARLQGEIITIPREFRDRIGKEEVEVFISAAEDERRVDKTDGLQQMLDHPLGIKNFQAPGRDEIYERD